MEPVWWNMPFIPTLRMQRQTNLVYKVSFRSIRATQRNLVLKGKKKEGRKEKRKIQIIDKQNVIFSTHMFGIFSEYLTVPAHVWTTHRTLSEMAFSVLS